MFKKLTLLAAIVGASALGFAAVAGTASAAQPRPPRPNVVVRGAGVLDAQGTGIVAVKGLIDYTATADGGILLVKDIAGDAQVDVTGTGGTTEWRGFKVYFGINGAAHITGSDVGVIVVGSNISLHVSGKGWAYLHGTGTFSVNGGGSIAWNPEGGFAPVAGPEPTPAP
jgi:hypothetical protein